MHLKCLIHFAFGISLKSVLVCVCMCFYFSCRGVLYKNLKKTNIKFRYVYMYMCIRVCSEARVCLLACVRES